ncbi:metallophosphoesterase [Clostridium cylindrosporum]|uniref:Calcineurin-like phosphoesterase domain-containing protein n=1 Tax=Clostridium cylindrosporum DSM 605 TaxID=1121307 RepID=A0A0J8D7B1_CLOCY|nr:metallophosphoesterase [Clostridium cylindrosporum]KMT21950.1 hypothetical protein CLCY_3c02210 [Clostridium cylindrosporum DSM 605]
MESIYLILSGIILLGVFFYWENNVIQTTRIKLERNLKSPIKIVHLSDIHSKEFGEGNHKLINKVVRLKPDLIIVTGDLINMDGKNINKMIGLLCSLNSIANVYYIFGNHEHRLRNLDKLAEDIKAIGVKLLCDEIDTININNNRISILGLDENQASRDDYIKRMKGIYEYKDYSNLFSKLESECSFKIVLSHYPENFSLIGDFSYKNYNFDLMMSGHAHGGQFRLPFIGGLYAPGQGVFPRYTAGLYKEDRNLIVSRGLGPSRFPLRLFNRPEIILVEVI